MTVAEFIVETQWTLLILLILMPITIGMLCSSTFRTAVLKRNWRVGPDGLASELPPVPVEELQAVVQTDEQVAANLAARTGSDSSVSPAAVAARRREAVTALLRDATLRGWVSAAAGSNAPPTPRINWTYDSSITMHYASHGDTFHQRDHRTWTMSRAKEINIHVYDRGQVQFHDVAPEATSDTGTPAPEIQRRQE